MSIHFVKVLQYNFQIHQNECIKYLRALRSVTANICSVPTLPTDYHDIYFVIVMLSLHIKLEYPQLLQYITHNAS